MTLSEETLDELADMRESLEAVAETEVPLAPIAQGLLDELDASEVSA